MYQQFYGLEEAPFNLTPDPRFLFLSQRHKEAIAALMYGINERKGFIALTGEIGSGKTTICRAIMNELAAGTKVALILNPALDALELLQSINAEFGIEHEESSKRDLLDHLNGFLLEQRALGHTCLLIIDESQNLAPEVLEQIRMISNLETETEKLIQIVLMGQPELRDTLDLPELEQLNQRITVKYHITPLTEEEVAQYIRHRMFIARARVDLHMETEALREIFDATGGIPRRINVLMDRILLTAYVDSTTQISEDIVRRALNEVKGSGDFGKVAKRRKAKAASKKGSGRAVKALVGMAAIVVLGAVLAVAAFHFFNLPGWSSFVSASSETPPQPQLPTNTFRAAPGAGSYLDVQGLGSSAVVVDDLLAPPDEGMIGGDPTRSWIYDSNGIVRVLNPEDSWFASLLTLMSISTLQRFDLSPLEQASGDRVQQFVNGAFEQLRARGFRQARIPDDLQGLLAYQMPMILTLQPNLANHSRYTVLVGTAGADHTLALFDPVHGLQNVDRRQLDPVFQGNAIALYHDPHGLTGLAQGASGESVAQLQHMLRSTGHFTGETTGEFDAVTAEALRAFQREGRARDSGDVTVETAILLSQVILPEEDAVQ